MTDSSTHSALDEYYFTFPTPNLSPIPPPSQGPVTPEIDPSVSRQSQPRSGGLDPVTPVRDPASIDRRGLIGVGDLTTPRWGQQHVLPRASWNPKEDGYVEVGHDDDDVPSSPWTIEAIDGEMETSTQTRHSPQNSLQVQLSLNPVYAFLLTSV
jgi:dual specificity tyrosine-phosphorylation-regulated kinase 2/3/4